MGENSSNDSATDFSEESTVRDRVCPRMDIDEADMTPEELAFVRAERQRTIFVVTRPSAIEGTGFLERLEDIGTPNGTPSGLDMETYEPYRAFLTSSSPAQVMESARLSGVSRFVPEAMCGESGEG